MKHLFFGGIHPKYNKEMSKTILTVKTIEPKTVVIPMVQHIGAPCTPLVQVGDRVKKGQKIGDGEGLCVPVHASVSGTVVAIEPRPHVRGTNIMAVVIENDFKMESVAPEFPTTDDEVLHAIREAGIVGMGGAAFPGNVKALGAMGNVDTLIANGCECEPYITADDTLLRTSPEQVLEGMSLLRRLLHPKRTVLAVEDNKTEAIAELQKLLPSYADIELAILPTRYPQGSEKQLIQAVTGRQVPPGQLPVKVGCAVFNVSTFAAIYRAVKLGTPLTERIVTVSGEAIAEPQNFLVPIGTSFHDLIEIAGGLHDKTERVISGGPMMGAAQYDLAVPTIKGTNAVTILGHANRYVVEASRCIRCGKCIDACPMHLMPVLMYKALYSGSIEEMNAVNLMDCIECGSCAYTCPAGVPLVLSFRSGKHRIREAATKKKG
jgi:electron transport complex protein RnfC